MTSFSPSLGQRQTQAQKQILSQKQIQFVKILQMGTQELNSYLNDFQLENPVVELEPPLFQPAGDSGAERMREVVSWISSGGPRTPSENAFEDDERHSFEEMVRAPDERGDLQSYLISQFDFSLTRVDLSLLDYLIHSLDESGYLVYSEEQIANATGAEPELVREGIGYLQSLDPAGVGARDLSECLCLQLDRLGVRESAAYQMAREHLEDMAAGRFLKIAKALGVETAEIRRLYGIIRQLNPRPAGAFGGGTPVYVVPDVTVIADGDKLSCVFNKGYTAKLNISKFYLTIDKTDPDAYDYVSQKISQAMWVMQAIEKRQSTIERIVGIILEWQREFFIDPHGALRPMNLRDLATLLDVHESTISRAVSDKYLLCKRGTFPLKSFFSGGLKASAAAVGEAGCGQDADMPVSSQMVKSLIEELIGAEPPQKPLSDSRIAEVLSDKGIKIARRTVAKYRDQLGIPPASLRAAQETHC